MNRKDRRAARSQERAGGTTADPRTSRRFNEALHLHQSGNLGGATEIYRQILDLDPNHVQSLQNLGAILIGNRHYGVAVELFGRALALNQASPDNHRNMVIALMALGRFDQAVACARRAVALKDDDVSLHLILGEALEKQSQFSEAQACYARAVALDSNNAAIHISLGKLYLLQGQLSEAEAALSRALALDSNLADAHFYFGNLRSQQGQPQLAVDCFLRAIEIKPEALEAHNNFCIALMAQSKFAEAIAHYEQVLAYKPDYLEGYCHLASAYRRAGDPRRALEIVRQALKLGETERARSLFALCLQDLPVVSYDGDMPDLLMRAMSEPWDRLDRLMGHGVNLVRADTEIVACIERAVTAWPTRLTAEQLFGPRGLGAVSSHRILRCMLENGLIAQVAMERFLTNVRSCLLQAASPASVGDIPEDESLAFYAAVARQCFINEYVYALTDQEQTELATLRAALIGALTANSPVPIYWLTAFAAYAPLHTLGQSETLLGRSWPAAVDALLAQQIREPLEELRLRDTIRPLTPIEDHVSVEVRNQYEENPYPRWVKAGISNHKQHLDSFLRMSFPSARLRSLGKVGAVDLLIAGCGTGQQLLGLAQTIAGARALAVDLSLSSLSYAKRQAEKLDLSNIEFGQADILQLGTLNRSFDVIECSGVLHHLGDPEAGWRVLLSLLRPNGLMRIALYSELARDHVVAGRKLIAERGIGRMAEDIRRFRQELLADPDTSLARHMVTNLDFFGTSMCRDLLFHVQEHRFTVPRIKTFLDANRLRFIGFEVPPAVRKSYAERFPEDATMSDLDCWHLFEQEHRRTFISMYQFWVQKGAGEPATATESPPPVLA